MDQWIGKPLKIRFILVNPAKPTNIGASARALKTMGFTNLALVNPPDILDGHTRALAHGAQDILEDASIYSSTQAACDGWDYVVGTTTRHRRTPIPYQDAHTIVTALEGKASSISSLAIMFGCEASGLSNDDIALCDMITTIKTGAPYPSLNLSHAVMVYAYELSRLANTTTLTTKDRRLTEAPPPPQEFQVLKERVSRILKTFELREPNGIMRDTLLGLGRLGRTEISLVQKITGQLEKKLGLRE